MALIQCPECNGKVSTHAVRCPHCGYPIEEWLETDNDDEDDDDENYTPPTFTWDGEQYDASGLLQGFQEKNLSLVNWCLNEAMAQRYGEDYAHILDGSVCSTQRDRILQLVCEQFDYPMYFADRHGYNEDYGYPPGESPRQKAMQAAHAANEAARIAALPKCPTCQSINIEKVPISSRILDGFFFGRHSIEGRAQFHCKNCDYRW